MNKSMKKISIISLIVVTMFITISFNTNIKAYTTNTDIDFNNKLTQGKDIAYYMVSGNQYTATIPQAVSKLRYPSGMWNPIVLTSTTVQKNSKMDMYQYSENDGNNAKTSVFRKNTAGVYYNSTSEMDLNDWVYGKIYINDTYMSAYDNNLRSTIILHEMLHVYGCKDINNTSSIMHYSTPSVRNLTSDANAVLVQKYN